MNAVRANASAIIGVGIAALATSFFAWLYQDVQNAKIAGQRAKRKAWLLALQGYVPIPYREEGRMEGNQQRTKTLKEKYSVYFEEIRKQVELNWRKVKPSS